MNTSITKTREPEEICQIVRTTLDFYTPPTGLRDLSLGENLMSIDMKYCSATPYCIQMDEFHIKDKDMQYFLNHITNQWNK